MNAIASPTLSARIAGVRRRIAAACERAGRNAAGVTLIAVSKTQPPEAVAAAFAEGVTDFGENRVQEALPKLAVFAAGSLRFHFIGHLQTNKAPAAVGAFAILHSIDSERALRAVDAAAHARSLRQRVMVEVNIAAEPTKFGIAPANLASLLHAAAALPHVHVEGLMTVAPRVAEPEGARPIFRALKALAAGNGLPSLSMGMSDDFEIAIEEGATHVRIGRAIFGGRVP
ncbi:MAG: YggS family pyridoxal phosphate-dependent enzyme [Tepidiformaceae bacterium]